MAVMSLPPAAALPILIGLTAGIYGCLAAMAVLPLSVEHMTLITVFVLNAHNLPQEGIIQAKSGINFVKTTLVRLAGCRADVPRGGLVAPARAGGGGGDFRRPAGMVFRMAVSAGLAGRDAEVVHENPRHVIGVMTLIGVDEGVQSG